MTRSHAGHFESASIHLKRSMELNMYSKYIGGRGIKEIGRVVRKRLSIDNDRWMGYSQR
jgi:hypothetical protein